MHCRGKRAMHSFREGGATFPIPPWVALNIISNNPANLETGESQAFLISKPACITLKISFLFLCIQDHTMKADFFFHNPEKKTFSQYPLLPPPHLFLSRVCTHSLTHLGSLWRFWTLALPSSAQLESLETRSCGMRIRELAEAVLGWSSGQVSSLSKVQTKRARQKQL